MDSDDEIEVFISGISRSITSRTRNSFFNKYVRLPDAVRGQLAQARRRDRPFAIKAVATEALTACAYLRMIFAGGAQEQPVQTRTLLRRPTNMPRYLQNSSPL